MSTDTQTIAIIQARMGSTRLPGKVAMPILGEPMLARMLERVKLAQTLDAIIVATTDKLEDDATAKIAEASEVGVFRGSEQDVLDRFYQVASEAKAEVVIRLTGDCPLMDPAVIDLVVTHFRKAEGEFDYSSTPRNYPEGLDIEIFNFSALKEAREQAKLPSEREHVSPYIKNHPEHFKCEVWRDGDDDHSAMHWSVDTQADFDLVTKIFEELYPANPSFNKDDIIALLAKHPEFLEINKGGTGYEGLTKSLKEDEKFKNSYDSTEK